MKRWLREEVNCDIAKGDVRSLLGQTEAGEDITLPDLDESAAWLQQRSCRADKARGGEGVEDHIHSP
jgi:hypothetical protein